MTADDIYTLPLHTLTQSVSPRVLKFLAEDVSEWSTGWAFLNLDTLTFVFVERTPDQPDDEDPTFRVQERPLRSDGDTSLGEWARHGSVVIPACGDDDEMLYIDVASYDAAEDIAHDMALR